jgi:hypothetical protein
MTIEAPSSRQIGREARFLRQAVTRFCVLSPLKRMLHRDRNLDATYYLGILLRERVVMSPGMQQFVSRTRTVADPFDVLYHASPCC